MLCWISWCSEIPGSAIEERAGVSLDLLVSVLMQGLFLRMSHSSLEISWDVPEPGQLKVQLQTQPHLLCQLHFSQLVCAHLAFPCRMLSSLSAPVPGHVPLPEEQADPGPPLQCPGPALCLPGQVMLTVRGQSRGMGIWGFKERF